MSVDIAIAYNRYKFLGSEFLLWLWWMSEAYPKKINEIAPGKDAVSIEFAGGMIIENEKPKTKIAIQSEDGEQQEAAIAICDGGRIKEASFVLKSGENEFSFVLTSADLALKSIKTPKTGPSDSQDEIEGAVLEKIYFDQMIFDCLDSFHKHFIETRVTSDWRVTVMPGVLEWLSEKTGNSKGVTFQHELFSPDGRSDRVFIYDDDPENNLLEDEDLPMIAETEEIWTR